MKRLFRTQFALVLIGGLPLVCLFAQQNQANFPSGASNPLPTAATATESTNTVTLTTVSGNFPAAFQPGGYVSVAGCSVAGYDITAPILSGNGGTTLTYADSTGSLGAATGCTASLVNPNGGTINGVTAGSNLTGGGTSGNVTLSLQNPNSANTSGNAATATNVAGTGLTGGPQGGYEGFSSTGAGLPINEPQSSLGFTGTDRCAAIHSCVLATVNGIPGDVCDARAELHNPAFTCNSNPLPIQADGINGGELLLPSGRIPLPTCGQMFSNQFDMHGTSSGDALIGGTSFQAASGFAIGSGGTYCPAVLVFGQAAWQAGTGSLFGPYSSHWDTFDVDCNSVSGIGGMTILSGQDNTWMRNLQFSNCVDFAVAEGNPASGDGPSIDSVYMTHSSINSTIANDPASWSSGEGAGGGGIPQTAGAWTVFPSGVNQGLKGVVVMNAPTGGQGANSASIYPYPGTTILLGADPSCSSYTTPLVPCTDLSQGVEGKVNQSPYTGAQTLRGLWVVGANSDFVSGATMDSGNNTSCLSSATSDACQIKFDVTADFPIDNGNISPLCSAGYSTAACVRNALVYMSNCTATSYYSGKLLVVTQNTGTTITGWVNANWGSSGCTGGCGTTVAPTSGTCGLAWAKSIDPGTFAGTPFTAANQIAFYFSNNNITGGTTCAGAPANTVTSYDCGAAGGSLITYSSGALLNGPDTIRPWNAWTFTSTSDKESAGSEYPASNLNVSGSNFVLQGNSHSESTKFEPFVLCQTGPCENIHIDGPTIVSNDAWSQGNNTAYGGVNNAATPGHASGIRIYNRFTPAAHGIYLTRIDMSPNAGGSNVTTNILQDDVNSNTIIAAACPIMDFYMIDQAGGVSTSCPCTSISNGISINAGQYCVRSGGVTLVSINATGYATAQGLGSGKSTNTDLDGEITLSGGSGSYTFLGTYTNRPECSFRDITTPANAVTPTVTNTSISITGTGTDVIGYGCLARN